MILRHPNQADWDEFLLLASSEGWRVPQFELELFRGTWKKNAYVLDDKGFCGLATGVAYEESAWIGNLIVPSNKRGKGYGSHLFKAVLSDLKAKGASTIWLTASEQGRSIYEREGFVAVDHVERWVLPGQRQLKNTTGPLSRGSYVELLHADTRVWGESRHLLLAELCKEGDVFYDDSSIALLQRGPDKQIVGPWCSREAAGRQASEFLQLLVEASDPSIELVMDCLASSQLQPSCESAGLHHMGKTTLMAYGDIAAVKLEHLVSFASLGSMG